MMGRRTSHPESCNREPRSRWHVVAMLVLAVLVGQAVAAVDYDIVYVRAPRHGDEVNTRWPEVKDPIRAEPGTDLMLLHPDGTEEVLVPGGDGAVVDPCVSFDGKSVYYARFHDLRPGALNTQRRDAPRGGSDIYRIDVETREVVQLTFGEWTPNTGAAPWSSDPLRAEPPGTFYLGYGIFNLGPCPSPAARWSSRRAATASPRTRASPSPISSSS